MKQKKGKKMQESDKAVQTNGGLLPDVREQTVRMINTAAMMFDRTMTLLFDSVDTTKTQEAILAMDDQIDTAQQEVRRNLVFHMCINPSDDAECCLALMVVAKDAERVGDYCKNLTEVAELSHGPLGDSLYGPALREICSEVSRLFAPTRSALSAPEMALVRLVVGRASDIRDRCGSFVHKIANNMQLNENEAVCIALAFRACRRISAHLANIVSAITGPIYGLGEAVDVFDGFDAPLAGHQTRQ